MKKTFEISFAREETELNKNKETAAKTQKKKSKNDKESIEKTDFSTEWDVKQRVVVLYYRSPQLTTIQRRGEGDLVISCT